MTFRTRAIPRAGAIALPLVWHSWAWPCCVATGVTAPLPTGRSYGQQQARALGFTRDRTPGAATFYHVMRKLDRYAFLMADKFAKRLKTLQGLTPYEYIGQCWQKEPERFTMNPYHHTLGLIT